MDLREQLRVVNDVSNLQVGDIVKCTKTGTFLYVRNIHEHLKDRSWRMNILTQPFKNFYNGSFHRGMEKWYWEPLNGMERATVMSLLKLREAGKTKVREKKYGTQK